MSFLIRIIILGVIVKQLDEQFTNGEVIKPRSKSLYYFYVLAGTIYILCLIYNILINQDLWIKVTGLISLNFAPTNTTGVLLFMGSIVFIISSFILFSQMVYNTKSRRMDL